MKLLEKAMILLVAFAAGVFVSFVAAWLYVQSTYTCHPGPLEPCDAGVYVGIGLAIMLSPILGTIFAFAAHRLIIRPRSS